MKIVASLGPSLSLVLGLGLALPGGGAWGQEPATAVAGTPPAAGGVVSGRVTFADTNGPARFSKVLLKSVAPGGGTDFFSELMKDDDDDAEAKNARPKKKKDMTPEQKEQMAGAAKVMAQLGDMLQSTTVAGDGTYLFNDVKPGTYYVHAMTKGYVDPLSEFSADELASTDPAVRKRVAAAATIVTVTGMDGAHADLRLERGGSISGRVLYDDGSPAVMWVVKTVKPAVAGEANPFAAMGLDPSDVDLAGIQAASTTDDLGYYRIAGLATGDYVVQARLTTGAIQHASATHGLSMAGGAGGLGQMMGLKLTVYSGDVVRQGDAKLITVKAGQNVADYNLTLPLRTLHALGGTVRAKSDGHAVNAGRVVLSVMGADGKEDASMHLMTTVRADGTFHFDYVPGPANYTVKVSGATDQTVTGMKKILGRDVPDLKVLRTYGPGSATVALGDSDVTDAVISVVEAAK